MFEVDRGQGGCPSVQTGVRVTWRILRGNCMVALATGMACGGSCASVDVVYAKTQLCQTPSCLSHCSFRDGSTCRGNGLRRQVQLSV